MPGKLRNANLQAVSNRKAHVKRTTWITLVVLAGVACSGQRANSNAARGQDTLTERQRDSVLARSRIPGASGVGKAMRVADSTSARVRASDSVRDSEP